MKLKLLCLFAGFCAWCGFAQNTWVQMDSVNGSPRSTAAAYSLNDQGWVACGYDGFDDKRYMHSYNPVSNDWDDEESLGGASGSGLSRKSPVGFAVKGFGYVGLGSGIALFFKDVWQYNDTTMVWTQVADFTGTARREAVAFSIDSIAYVGTGVDASGLCDDLWKYDPSSNSWSVMSPFPGGGRRDAVGFAMGGRAYFGTGVGASGMTSDFWEYNPVTDNWSSLPDFPGTARQGAVGVGLFPQAFIMLGDDIYSDFKEDVWEYNYFGNVWTQRADFPAGGRTQGIAFAAQDRIFVGTGYDGIWHDDLWEYQVLLGNGEWQNDEIGIFPNPAVEFFKVKMPFDSDIIIELYDESGRKCWSDNATGSEVTVPALSLSKGTFTIVLHGAEKITAGRVVIH